MRRTIMSRRTRRTRRRPVLKTPANHSDIEKFISHRPHPLTSQPASHRDYSVHEISNLPASAPPSAGTGPATSSTSRTSKASSSRFHVPSTSVFVPLPYLQTENLTEIEDAAAHSSLIIHTTPNTLSVPAVTTTTTTRSNAPHQPSTSHLSTAAIIALAVSGGLTFFVVFFLVKFVMRPNRRRTPTPSFPILHDRAFPDDKTENEGSPIFGGKERPSPTLHTYEAKGNAGLWTWTQYNSGISKPTPTVTVTRSSSQDQLLLVNQTAQRHAGTAVHNDTAYVQGTQGQYPFIGYGNSNPNSKSASPLRPVQNAITRAVSRLSTVSTSLYPNSPDRYSQAEADVGLAIDGITHGGQVNVNVTVPKYKERVLASRDRTSMVAPAPRSVKDAATVRRSQSLAYGGVRPTSPPTTSPNRAQLNGGRARIKSSYYTPGSYPRTSGAATNCGKHDLDQEHDYLEQNRVERSDPRRGRDLTSALGLTSPVPPSPQPTLYPDDSMSVIGEAKKVTVTARSQKKPAPKAGSHCDNPPSDMAALGSLMMVDFAGSKSTASLVNIRPSEAARARDEQGVTGKSSLKKRVVEDKPPRVPSPPPIPSLAQMALQQADPDYHSPTYSIYGLYDGDRKSRGLSSSSYGYS